MANEGSSSTRSVKPVVVAVRIVVDHGREVGVVIVDAVGICRRATGDHRAVFADIEQDLFALADTIAVAIGRCGVIQDIGWIECEQA